jgi:hypothetical protein
LKSASACISIQVTRDMGWLTGQSVQLQSEAHLQVPAFLQAQVLPAVLQEQAILFEMKIDC